MRLAVISDIHGNDIALERVLAAVAGDRPDGIVCLGDVAGTGPQPHAAVERLRACGARVVMGNVDWYMLHPESVASGLDEAIAMFWDIDLWCAEQMTAADRTYMGGFERSIALELGTGESVLCFHGSPSSFDDRITATTPDADLERFFHGYNSAVYAGGHTHFAMVRRHGSALVLNPGSVGMSYDRTHPTTDIRFAQWAEYALLTIDTGTCSVELRRVEYDKSLVSEAVRASGMPHADWLADEWAR